MTRNRKSFKLADEGAAKTSVKYFIQRIWSTPSMYDKLPKYLIEHLDALELYVEREGWEWLDG